MTHTVLALRHGAAFKDIVKAMPRWQVSAAPVLDDDGRGVSVVSEADLLRKEEIHAADRTRTSIFPTRSASRRTEVARSGSREKALDHDRHEPRTRDRPTVLASTAQSAAAPP
ncbi:hypothetical protein ACFXDH_18040 [Streptomyces sp. NPDC059467]|uniref:hypothetical protein n=1 Tax=Streptomyces sp. NPDC059467 TaxID=3346844 RepID=UPI0036C6D296